MAAGATSAGGESKALSVSAAVGLAKGTLEGIVVRVIGEVSEVSAKAGYKAVYFTVKDTEAALPCMMWNNRYRAAGISLKVGQLVELSGRFTVYPVRGTMNFDVFSLSLAGEGALRLQVANLARQLQAEGLTAPERKRPVPALPQCVGLVTSAQGAAVHDVLRTMRRRYPVARVLLAGVQVEGAQAPDNLIAGMRCVAEAGAELILLVRGGGSYESMMPYNDERLARAIAACPVPVVTGIGHEPDNFIADIVADVRASNPTNAVGLALPDANGLRERLEGTASLLELRTKDALSRARMRCDRAALSPLFSDPMRLIGDAARRIDDLDARLSTAIPRALERDRRTLERLSMSAAVRDPRRMVEGRRRAVDDMGRRLAATLPRDVGERRRAVEGLRLSLARLLPSAAHRPAQRLAAVRGRLRYQGEVFSRRPESEMSVMAGRLHALSPLAVIARGYAIARDGEGNVLKSVEGMALGQVIEVMVSDGKAVCSVEETQRIDMETIDWEES